MERVQWNQEQMITELKDLQEKRIFSAQEVRDIFKKRTAFETALIRRAPRKQDFLTYIEYEMNLEQLRRLRVKKMKVPKTHSVSDHSIVQRQYTIFERATRRFKNDIRLWVQYIDVAQKEHATQLAARTCARALKLHPNCTALYVLAAQQELDQGSPSSARILLQRGLRLNPESVDMWVEYVKMELNFVEILRRRWETLGIDGSSKHDKPELDVEDSEAARASILKGAIVKQVIQDAVTSLPKLETFTSLLSLLDTHPSPLSTMLLQHTYHLLPQTLPRLAKAKILYAGRHLNHTLHPDLAGGAFVEAFHAANEELVRTMRSETTSSIEEEYAKFVAAKFKSLPDSHMRLYLISTVHNLCVFLLKSQSSPVTPSLSALLATHLTMLTDTSDASTIPDPQKALKLARKYAAHSSSPELWLLRLELEAQCQEDAMSCWNEARRSCAGPGVEKIWIWGLQNASLEIHEELLKESLTNSKAGPHIHHSLFLQTISHLYNNPSFNSSKARAKALRRLFETLLPTFPDIYKHAFLLESAVTSNNPASESKDTLRMIYDAWIRMDSSGDEPILHWATWLLQHNFMREAGEVVAGALSSFGDDAERRETLERRWRRVLDGETEHDMEDAQVQERQDDRDNDDDTMEDDQVGGSDDDEDIVFIE